MVKSLTRVGNSLAFILTKEMRQVLDVTTSVEVIVDRDQIILRKPKSLSVEQSMRLTERRYDEALKNLAK